MSLVTSLVLGMVLALIAQPVLAAVPTVASTIPNQTAVENVAFNFQFAANTFSDTDGDTLTYVAQLNGGGALPAWLSFNGATRTFSGTPNNSDVGTISLDVMADDSNGGTVTDTFDIVVFDASATTCGTFNMTDDSGVCQINNCDQLIALANGADAAALARSYRLTADLTCPGDAQSIPIGSRATPFTGTFDGDNHLIEYLNVDAASSDSGGLFGGTSAATITDLRLFYTNINRTTYVGALVGEAINGTVIKNVHSTLAQLQGATSNSGGLVGRLENSTISYSSATSAKVGSGSGNMLGGLVGVVVSNNTLAISNSYATGSQDFGATTVQGQDHVGGLVGFLQDATIQDVYAQTAITSTELTGGLVGQATTSTIRNAYSAGSMSGVSASSVGGMLGDIVDAVTIQNTFTAVSGTGTMAFYGTAQGSVTLLNNFYHPGLLSKCFTDTDGQEQNCGYDDGGVSVGNWLDLARQPVKSWDNMTTWSLNSADGSYPTLVAEGTRARSTITQGQGTAPDPYLINDCLQLQHLDEHLGAYFRLTTDIDCYNSIYWNGGKGFDPIGDNEHPFTGNLDGNDKTISNLYINRVNDTYDRQVGDEDYVGLFGYIEGGSAYDLNIANAKVRGYEFVGGLVGLLDGGAVDGVNVNTAVSSNNCLSGGHCIWARYGAYGGGIAGGVINVGTIVRSHTGGPVKGSGVVIGGIAGIATSGSIIEDVSSSSDIDGGVDVGGIVGRLQNSSLTDALATGFILAQTDDIKAGDYGGGAVGTATDSIVSGVDALGDVEGKNHMGGLIGSSTDTQVLESSASGNVIGASEVGGIVGTNERGLYSQTYYSAEEGTVYSDLSAGGGFVGQSNCEAIYEFSGTNAEVFGFGDTGGFTGKEDCGDPIGSSYEFVQAIGDVNGHFTTGGLVGTSLRSLISNSQASGDVYGAVDSGGLVGEASGDGAGSPNEMRIQRSFATGNVSNSEGGAFAGGLVGGLVGGVIRDSYARGDVFDSYFAGGLVGSIDGDSAVRSAYATGNLSVPVPEDGSVDGIAALVYDTPQLEGVFWDTQTTGVAQGDYGTGLPTVQMTGANSVAIFADAGWDFGDTWGFDTETNDAYMCLQWTDPEVCAQQDGAPTVTDSDGDGVLDEVEQAGPKSGDANGDGIQDYLQANVTSLYSNESKNYVVVQTTCDSNFNVQTGGEPTEQKDVGYDYPAGLQAFVGRDCGAPGSSVVVTLLYFGNYKTTDHVIRKWTDGTTYTTIAEAVMTNATIGGQQALKATYAIIDGGKYDQDKIADSNVVDPVGMALSTIGVPNTGFQKN